MGMGRVGDGLGEGEGEGLGDGLGLGEGDGLGDGLGGGGGGGGGGVVGGGFGGGLVGGAEDPGDGIPGVGRSSSNVKNGNRTCDVGEGVGRASLRGRRGGTGERTARGPSAPESMAASRTASSSFDGGTPPRPTPLSSITTARARIPVPSACLFVSRAASPHVATSVPATARRMTRTRIAGVTTGTYPMAGMSAGPCRLARRGGR